MNMQASFTVEEQEQSGVVSSYLETVGLIERLHRQLLEMIGQELKSVGVLDVNSTQALLLFNIGMKSMAVGELRSRGYYQGTNVSYSMKKLSDFGYIDTERSEADRRSVRVQLTERGKDVHLIMAALFQRNAREFASVDRPQFNNMETLNRSLLSFERCWADELRAFG